MFDHLQIYDSRERMIVGAADVLLKPYAAAARVFTSRQTRDSPRRILLLRLERIGDLLMTLGAINAVRDRVPDSTIHLVVGSWNESLVPLISGIDSYETLDVPWLARHTSGTSLSGLIQRAGAWRTRRFDLAVNFEPDIRTNLLLSLSRAPRRVGFSSAGGDAFLTDSLVYEPVAHTAANAVRLVDVALPRDPSHGRTENRHARLHVPEPARQQALTLLDNPDPSAFFVGIHASGGRAIKQWLPDRFAEVAARIARNFSGAVVLTGTPEDRPIVDRISSRLPADVRRIDVAGVMDLPVLAGLLERLNLFVTADTGPMHLAAAVGTPVVGLFGPSDPRRYGPLSNRARVVTADLWCRPCNRVRRPPVRCEGRVPDCMEGIDVEKVYGQRAKCSARHRRAPATGQRRPSTQIPPPQSHGSARPSRSVDVDPLTRLRGLSRDHLCRQERRAIHFLLAEPCREFRRLVSRRWRVDAPSLRA